MTSASTCMSLADISRWQFINHLPHQWLSGRFASTQSVEANLLARYVYLASNEAIAPMRVYCIWPPKYLHHPLVGAATDEDHNTTFDLCLRIERPLLGKGSALRRSLDSRSASCAMGCPILARWPLPRLQRFIMPSGPHLRLPRAVV